MEQQRQQTLRAPVAGVIQQSTVHTVGGVVTSAQALMVLVPENHQLELDVMILNKDVGFVLPGQAVEVKIDSFPYTRFGTLSGEVKYISRDALEDQQQGLVFPARIRLNSDTLIVEGKPVRLSAGMAVSAEIKTGRRRVIDYLLSPLQQYQAEAMRER
ncbi:HlyD family secretion protein [Yersinia kristensenii]|nr:HlyD family secretion protein [Yersinia kristensenii]